MPRPLRSHPSTAPAGAAEAHLVAALTAAVDASRLRRVRLDVLREAAVAADGSVASRHGRTRLWAAIAALRDAGRVRLPHGAQHWDDRPLPRLPRWVDAVRAARPVTPPATWPADLALPAEALARLAELTPRAGEADLLVAVSRWLAAGGARRSVPARERALELFGDEKALDRPNRLFTRGVLSLELLHAEAVPQPLVATWVPGTGDGEPLCVVAENQHTWVSLLRAARAAEASHAGVHVGYGAGTQFRAGVLTVSELRPAVRAVSYFGDLDAAGLQIPALAAATARAAGLPGVVPAVGLYRRLLGTRHRLPATPVEPATAATRAAWLGPALADPAAALLAAGLRVPQEAVGTDLLTGTAPRTWV